MSGRRRACAGMRQRSPDERGRSSSERDDTDLSLQARTREPASGAGAIGPEPLDGVAVELGPTDGTIRTE